MSYTYRCGSRDCRKQVTFKKKLEDYVREKCCAHCRGKLHRFTRDKKRDKARTCYCDGYPFYHRQGTAPWCVRSTREPTEEEMEQRYGGG